MARRRVVVVVEGSMMLEAGDIATEAAPVAEGIRTGEEEEEEDSSDKVFRADREGIGEQVLRESGHTCFCGIIRAQLFIFKGFLLILLFLLFFVSSLALLAQVHGVVDIGHGRYTLNVAEWERGSLS